MKHECDQYTRTTAMQAKLTTSNRYGNLWVCNLSSRTPFSHHWQVSMSEEQRPGFQSAEEKVGLQDNKLHEGPQQGLVLTHAPITVSTACILFQTLLNGPHTPWENICFCTQIAILLLYSHIYMDIILVHMSERESVHTHFCTETTLKELLNNKIIIIISLSHVKIELEWPESHIKSASYSFWHIKLWLFHAHSKMIYWHPSHPDYAGISAHWAPLKISHHFFFPPTKPHYLYFVYWDTGTSSFKKTRWLVTTVWKRIANCSLIVFCCGIKFLHTCMLNSMIWHDSLPTVCHFST